jgi:hypothetical protein
MEERDMNNEINELAAVLAEIVGQENPNRWGYDAAHVALNDEWRARARAALARFDSLQDLSRRAV